ncbi:MAG: cyclic pyranopterin monophosphate synthase MoaC [Desulfobacteraceae bacterium]
MGMIDVGDKPVVLREAEAVGRAVLSTESIQAIKQGKVKKGDPLMVAEIAGLNAAKQTSVWIPHCHQISLDTVGLSFSVTEDAVEVRCRVKARARTGVEMEALVGVSAALCTIWDMVKYLEKDSKGQYPNTSISQIKVVMKVKQQ